MPLSVINPETRRAGVTSKGCLKTECVYNNRMCVCYYEHSGASGSACTRSLYSTTDVTGAECILDATGCINWMAVGYS